MINIVQEVAKNKEQFTYIETRLRDLENVKEVKNINPIPRVFTGDNPARQFESEQQRGGKFSCVCGVPTSEHNNFITCYTTEPLTLEERRRHVVAAWRGMAKDEYGSCQSIPGFTEGWHFVRTGNQRYIVKWWKKMCCSRKTKWSASWNISTTSILLSWSNEDHLST